MEEAILVQLAFCECSDIADCDTCAFVQLVLFLRPVKAVLESCMNMQLIMHSKYPHYIDVTDAFMCR